MIFGCLDSCITDSGQIHRLLPVIQPVSSQDPINAVFTGALKKKKMQGNTQTSTDISNEFLQREPLCLFSFFQVSSFFVTDRTKKGQQNCI